MSTFDHWWTKQINDRARNKVRKAAKNGVVVRHVPFGDTLVRGIWEIYNECPVRQGKPFWHYGKDLETVRALESTLLDISTFIAAFMDERIIGFIKLLVDKDRRQAKTMNIISMIQHRDKAPMNALIAEAVKTCADWNIPHLVYGRYSYGKKTQDTLAEFKRNNGFERIEIPRFYIPLTVLGRVAYALGLHRGVGHYAPEAVMAKVRQLRKAWYERALDSWKSVRRLGK